MEKRVEARKVDFLAQVIDVDVHKIGLGIEGAIPDSINNHRFTHRLGGGSHEKFEKRKLAIGQFDCLSRAGHRARDQVHRQIFDSEPVGELGRWRRSSALTRARSSTTENGFTK